MKHLRVFIAMLALASSAGAWNFTGHRVIAAIAYDRLTPAAREGFWRNQWRILAHPHSDE